MRITKKDLLVLVGQTCDTKVHFDGPDKTFDWAFSELCRHLKGLEYLYTKRWQIKDPLALLGWPCCPIRRPRDRPACPWNLLEQTDQK